MALNNPTESSLITVAGSASKFSVLNKSAITTQCRDRVQLAVEVPEHDKAVAFGSDLQLGTQRIPPLSFLHLLALIGVINKLVASSNVQRSGIEMQSKMR